MQTRQYLYELKDAMQRNGATTLNIAQCGVGQDSRLVGELQKFMGSNIDVRAHSRNVVADTDIHESATGMWHTELERTKPTSQQDTIPMGDVKGSSASPSSASRRP